MPVRLGLAAAGGLVLVAAFPPYDLWPAAPVSVALLVLAAAGGSATAGAAVGMVHGLAFFLPLLAWSGVYVGAPPWLLLAGFQAGFHVVLGAGVAVVLRIPGWPVWVAALWVGEEAVRARVPWHGFPWGRLGFGLADSPYLHLAALGGPVLMGFAAALTGTLLAAATLRAIAARSTGHGPRHAARPVVIAGAGAVALTGLPLLVALPGPGGPDVRVAVIQGNVPRLGLDFNAQRRAVLRNSAARTSELAARVRAGELPRPRLVIWPENSSDLDPYRDPETFAVISAAVADIGVPVLVGAVLDGPGRFLSNTGIVWDPATGPGARYVKRQPVPFGEYIPMRGLARRISDKVDLVARDFAPGSRVGVLDLGGVRVGDLICFEVGDDDLARDVVAAGAELLVVQTNNATFGWTPQSEQQLAMSRVRAAEHGRAVLVAATSGISAVVRPDASVPARAEIFTPAVLVADVPTGTRRTPAGRAAPVLEVLLTTLGTATVAVAGVLARRRPGRALREAPPGAPVDDPKEARV